MLLKLFSTVIFAGERQTRLQKLQDLLQSVDESTMMHFELASYAEEKCFQDVIDHVVLHVDSLGKFTLFTTAEKSAPKCIRTLRKVYHLVTNGLASVENTKYPAHLYLKPSRLAQNVDTKTESVNISYSFIQAIHNQY